MAELIVGMAELNKKLQALGPAAGGKALRNAVGFSMTPVRAEFKKRIPKGTRAHKTYKGRVVAPGFASRNITKSTRMSRDKKTVRGVVGVRSEAFYLVQFVELGTSKMRAQPTLRPSFKAKKVEVVKRLQTKLKQNIDKVSRQ